MVVLSRKLVELFVGLFIVAGIAALVVLAFKVSGLSGIGNNDHYALNAEFDNIGSLKVRAPVSVSGVKIGQVVHIQLDPNSFRAKVIMHINKAFSNLPSDTSASIFTQGILGANYISLSPGFDQDNLAAGDSIETTHSALVLENLIGQLIYSMKSDGSSTDTKDSNAKSATIEEQSKH
jgi:phospholipid/cholesterol/gamma-HCH transport system substrate-binding protein